MREYNICDFGARAERDRNNAAVTFDCTALSTEE